jgi:hypothetical protein
MSLNLPVEESEDNYNELTNEQYRIDYILFKELENWIHLDRYVDPYRK